MRDRLLVAFLTLVVAVIGVFLVERAYATSAVVHDGELRAAERTAEVVAAILDSSRTRVTPELLDSVAGPGEQVVYLAPSGDRVEGADEGMADTAPSEDDLSVSRAVADGGTVTVTRRAALVDDRVEDAILSLVLLSLALLLVAVVVAVWLARRLVRPFADLAHVAGQIGRGHYDVEVPRSSVPEADAVARALRATASDLDGLSRRERYLAVHASHELRTPLTAARLELEDLTLSSSTPPDVAARVSAAMSQLDRLSSNVAGMLDATRDSILGSRVDIDLAALVRDTASGWARLADGRSIRTHCEGVVPVRLPAGSLMQVMDVLVGNAVTHGEGDITVTMTEAPAYVEVEVSDQGCHGAAVEGATTRLATGHGSLATATRTVSALGGQLRLTAAATTTFSLVLPRSPRETVEP